MEKIKTSATNFLDQNNIPHDLFVHENKIRSLEQAAIERGQSPGQVVRSILFRIEEGDFIMVLVAGPNQISWKDLRHYLGHSRITMASSDEVFKITGYRVGAVSPFGLPQSIRTLVDKSILRQQEISLGSGVRGVAIIMKTKDLVDALGNVEIVNLREHE